MSVLDRPISYYVREESVCGVKLSGETLADSRALPLGAALVGSDSPLQEAHRHVCSPTHRLFVPVSPEYQAKLRKLACVEQENVNVTRQDKRILKPC